MDYLNNIINEVVVVEGYHDLAKLKEVFQNIDVVITNGSEISEDTLNELKILNQKRGLILFLDPDYQGERIRRLINEHVGETKHAFLKKIDCISKNKKKIGIEHASKQTIINAFINIKSTNNIKMSKLNNNDLLHMNLIGTKLAKQNRKILCEELGIGLCNGKTLLKKLNMFNISLEDINRVIRK
jgi:ribonuclease M5